MEAENRIETNSALKTDSQLETLGENCSRKKTQRECGFWFCSEYSHSQNHVHPDYWFSLLQPTLGPCWENNYDLRIDINSLNLVNVK